VPMLEHAPLFRSKCPEETRGFLGDKDHRFDIDRSSTALDVTINGIYLPGTYLGYLSYGDAEVSAASGPSHSEYWLHLPVSGAFQAELGSERVAADVQQGLLLAPSQRPWRLTAGPGSARLQLALDPSAVVRLLEVLLGDTLAQPLEFEPTIELGGGHGRTIARYVLLAARDLEDPRSPLAEPATLAAFEEFVVTALLMSQPHTHSGALRRADRQLAPRDIKRAVEFIHEHMHRPIGISEIAGAAGVPGRTLFKHFRDFKGVSPMRFLRDARLARARQMLRSPGGGTSVTSVAIECGFAHFGRFSVDYRNRFGEAPSKTLSGARPRPGH